MYLCKFYAKVMPFSLFSKFFLIFLMKTRKTLAEPHRVMSPMPGAMMGWPLSLWRGT